MLGEGLLSLDPLQIVGADHPTRLERTVQQLPSSCAWHPSSVGHGSPVVQEADEALQPVDKPRECQQLRRQAHHSGGETPRAVISRTAKSTGCIVQRPGRLASAKIGR